MPKLMTALMTPKAKTPIEAVPAQHWFTIRAVRRGLAEIAIYDEIGGWGITAREFSDELKAYGDLSLIDLHIHSPGGDVFEGMAIYNLLVNHPARVEVTIDGVAASMASVVAMAGDRITMPENAMMMVHRPWGIQGGDADQMRRYAELLDKVEGNLVSAYTKKSGLSDDEVRGMLAVETWLTGPEAVERGFADQLAEPLTAAASLQSHRMKEFANMPEALKHLMKPRGQGPAPQEPKPNPQGGGHEPTPQDQQEPKPQGNGQQQPAARHQETAPPDPRFTPAEAAGNADEFKQQEKARREAVKAVFAPFAGKFAEVERACLDDLDVSAEAAKDKLLAALGRGTTPTAGPRKDAGAFADNGNIVGDGIRNAVAGRIGIEKREKDNAYAGMTLSELARASLSERGVGIAGMDRLQMVGMAFTHSSSDFGHLLADVAHKSMLRGYEEAEETFQRWTTRGVLTDFKPNRRVDLSTFPSLPEVPEGAEYSYGSVGDRGEQIMLATYGKLLSITRQAIINDDLSALDRIPRLMGRAAIRTVGDLVYAVLIGNPAMSDGHNLFSTQHKNQLSAGALSIARLDEGKTKMATQKDGKATLNIRPGFLLTPVALESTANAFVRGEFDPANPDARIPNPVRDMVEVVADARLDDASATTTYLTASPGAFDTVEVAYLDGNDTPYLEEQQGFTVDGATFKVRMDAGVAPLSWRTMVKLPGS
ncbi:MAG: ClpP-like prohead protease/major capsid protein fusion protein [Pseudomonadota bacterium]